MIARANLSSAFFIHLLTPSMSDHSQESSHLTFGLPAFFLPSGFSRNTFLTTLSSNIITTWPAYSSLLTFIVVQPLALRIIAILPHHIASSVEGFYITDYWILKFYKNFFSSPFIVSLNVSWYQAKKKRGVFEPIRSISLLNLVSLLIFRC